MATKHPLQSMIEEAGYETSDYSGRGMYGKRCLSITVDSGQELGSIISGLMEQCLNSDPDGGDEFDDMHKAAQAVRHISWDSMGRGMVYYWPSVPYTADDEGEEDEDGETED